MDDQTPQPFDYQNQDANNPQGQVPDPMNGFAQPQQVPQDAYQDTGAYQFVQAEQQPAPAMPTPIPEPASTEQQAAPFQQPQNHQPDPTPTQSYTDNNSPTVYTGLSGNELYCLNLIGYRPGNLVVGNSVYALGFVGSIASSIHTTIGGEIPQFTNMIAGGRKLSLQRLDQELAQMEGHGATGVTSELVFHPGNIEFLSVGSSIHRQDGQPMKPVTSSSDGQEFYCQTDAGYMPMSFVLGNVAYSIGIARNLMGELKELTKGEIKQYSNVFNLTRSLALQRITEEAKAVGANSIIGIRTTILPIGTNGVQEMVMLGTASYNEQVAQVASDCGGIITSDLTAEETWSITKLGYVPMKLILGTSVYSLGVVGGVRAAIRGFVKGEISALTQMIYGAREESLKKVQQQAQEIGADDVLGIKTYIYQLSGDVIEFLAIGTAVKRVNGVSTRSDQIPPQAIIRDKKTFVNTADMAFNTNLNTPTVGHQSQEHTV